MNLLHPFWAEINLDNFIYNINEIKSHIGNSKIIGIVKANAYGHGAVEISKTLLENGAETLAVANIVEGIELREADIKAPIMILGVSEEFAIDAIINYDMEPTISSLEFANTLNNKAKESNKTINIHIALDTGMGRIGFLPSSKSLEEIALISKLSNLKIKSTFSHFSTSDYKDKNYSNFQLKTYNDFISEIEKYNIPVGNRNLSNSAAIIDIPNAHFDNVRPGIIQYGYYPSDEVIKENFNLKPVLTWKTNIVHIKEVNKGAFIGYGKTFETKRKSIIATIPVGYADGYSRGLSNKGKVIINGQFAPIIGNVCMDQCMVDITDLKDVNLNDEVILLGSDNNIKFDADDMANLLGTINYEVLCLIGRRAPRVYIKNNKVVTIKHFI